MKVLLMEDVYKLGRAGDVKKVADGYGRNYLLPHGLAVLATPGALKQVEEIRSRANSRRSALNQEMGSVADKLANLALAYPARSGRDGQAVRLDHDPDDRRQHQEPRPVWRLTAARWMSSRSVRWASTRCTSA